MQENARSHNNVVFVCTYPKTNYFLNIQKEKLRRFLMVSRNVKIWTNLSLVSFVAFCDNDSHLFQAWYRWQIFKTKTYKTTKIRILVEMCSRHKMFIEKPFWLCCHKSEVIIHTKWSYNYVFSWAYTYNYRQNEIEYTWF